MEVRLRQSGSDRKVEGGVSGWWIVRGRISNFKDLNANFGLDTVTVERDKLMPNWQQFNKEKAIGLKKAETSNVQSAFAWLRRDERSTFNIQ